MKSCVKMLVVTFFLAALIPELVLSSKKAKKLPKVYNLHPANDSMSNVYTRIVGGKQAHRGVYPWQAVLVRNDNTRSIFCGGSLIKDQWVLTAAHCLEGENNNNYLVRLGAYKSVDPKFNTYGQEFTVVQSIVHDQYNIPNDDSNDVALLKLDKAAVTGPNVKKINLPTAGDAANRVGCVVTGFGAINSQGQFPEYMQQVDVIVKDRSKCVDLFKPLVIDATMLCAGRNSGGYDTCQGDSGGPLACRHKVGTAWYLHGVTSWGVGCGEPKLYGVYADVINLLKWINTNAV